MNQDLEKLQEAQQAISLAVDALRNILKASNPLIIELFFSDEITSVIKVKQKLERIISLIE